MQLWPMLSADQPLLAIRDLDITFGEASGSFHAVRGLSLQLAAGKTLAIVGESGSGKSLTALSLMGLLPVNAQVGGSMVLSEKGKSPRELNGMAEASWRQLRGKTMGMVFQEPMSALNPVMTVGKQLRESIQTHQAISAKEAKAKAIEWLEKVKLPSPDKIYKRYPHQLSGGQKQRIMIAMAMCCNPSLLIADEPTTALDATVQQEIISLMRDLQQQTGAALIFITHDLALASEIADDVLVLYKGAVVEYGPAREVLTQPQQLYTQALLACRPDTRNKGKRLPIVADFTAGGTREPVLQALEPVLPGAVLLQVKDMAVWFPEERNLLGKPLNYFKAVDGVSFELRSGETLGLVGESGCGKSTVSKALMGLAPIHSGSAQLGSTELAQLRSRDWQPVRRKMQMVFQDPFASLNPRMTVGAIITEPLLVHSIMSQKEAAQEAGRLLEMVQLPAASASRYPHQFSGGQRQRIGIARALSLKPQVLICDESVSALDVSVQAQVLNLLKDLQRTFGLAYLFISHDLSVVHYMSDRVMVMRQGKIVESGEAGQLLLSPREAYTQELVAAMPRSRYA
jgi:peptide/nickel transport system ATP-binding protein